MLALIDGLDVAWLKGNWRSGGNEEVGFSVDWQIVIAANQGQRRGLGYSLEDRHGICPDKVYSDLIQVFR